VFWKNAVRNFVEDAESGSFFAHPALRGYHAFAKMQQDDWSPRVGNDP
jgi:hypothetical protein